MQVDEMNTYCLMTWLCDKISSISSITVHLSLLLHLRSYVLVECAPSLFWVGFTTLEVSFLISPLLWVSCATLQALHFVLVGGCDLGWSEMTIGC